MTPNRSAFASRLAKHLSVPLVSLESIGGGDINQAFRAQSTDGEAYFVKTHPHPPPGFFSKEAQGLELLSQTQTVSIPAVVSVIEEEDFSCLVLEWIDAGPTSQQSALSLGQALANLHRVSSDTFGLKEDNYLGTLPQPNLPTKDWVEFYRDRRLNPLLQRAHQRGMLPLNILRESDVVLTNLSSILGPMEKPSLLHGDLWGGNRMVDQTGTSWLIDPAVYFGNREIDVAMMRLFGGFTHEVFEAYHATYPLSPGWEERIDIYQLYPMLVHLNLFGTSYLGSIERILRRYR